jgi:diacylglycerol O-acyltransferase
VRAMTTMDAVMYHVDSPRAPNTITFVNIYDGTTRPGGPLTFEAVLEGVGQRLHLARAFRERIVTPPLGLGYPYWVDDENFDLEYHVRQIALPRPGSWQQLCTQASRLAARQLDLSRAPWELYVIEGLDDVEGLPEGGVGLVLKIHHSAIDGVTGAEMLSAISSTTPEPEPVTPPPWEASPAPGKARLAVQAGAHLVTRPKRLVDALGPLGRAGVRAVRREYSLPTAQIPRTRFGAPLSSHRVFDATGWPLADVKSIRALAPGVTVNDVALAVVSGALRAYLEAHGELPQQTLTSIVPVSLRDESKPGVVGNEIASMMVPLATDVADPVERLAAIGRATKESKARKQAVGARTLTDLAAALPGGLLGAAIKSQGAFLAVSPVQTRPNTVVTNVPGSTVPLYFMGMRMKATYGLAPLAEGIGLFHIVSSYTGTLTMSFTADRDVLTDPEMYMACLCRSFGELAAAAAANPPADAP